MNRTIPCAVALCLVHAIGYADTNSDAQMIKVAQNVSAHALDPQLPRIPFAEWVRSIAAPGSRMDWEVNDCGEQTGNPADAGQDFPLCAEVRFEIRPGVVAYVDVAVGSDHHGVYGEPVVFQLFTERDGGYQHVSSLLDLKSMADARPKP
ncbi:hypothetical protein AACH06_19655 [Ideonella sp. DXS29W]|uniref:Uncharacterized protein n=1 Tax=Ideonella lacteola TaxID=2984193 RepID=A0ABU9BVY9_9BURK